MSRRVGRGRGYDRVGDLLVSPPKPGEHRVGSEVVLLRSVPFCSPRRCPYLKTRVASSVALVAAVVVVLTGALWLNGFGGSLQSDVVAGAVESRTGASEVARRQDRPRRGKRSKQKAVTSSFRHDRAAEASAGATVDLSYEDLQVSSWVWLSQVERERGFSLRHSTLDGLQAEVALLPADPADDQCAEGWAGESCLECAPGFGGDFCVRVKPQVDIYNYQVNMPPAAEIHLRDYLPPAEPERRARGSAVFSAGVSIVQASAAAV